MSSTGDFIGQGWAFRPDPSDPQRRPGIGISPGGGIALAHGVDELDGSLRMILETAPGERVMRPAFGCAMWDHLFDTIDPNTLGLIAQAVREAVGRWEPRVELEDVLVRTHHSEAHCVLIDVAYVIKATNDRRNLVHPFYVIPHEE